MASGRLLELALEGRRVVLEDLLLDVLLGDRRAALLDVAGLHVRAGGPEDRPRVDAVVAVEALVLDGDHGVAHVRRDLLERDDLAVLLGVERVHERAVGGVERGRLDLLRRRGGRWPATCTCTRRARPRTRARQPRVRRSTGHGRSTILPHRARRPGVHPERIGLDPAAGAGGDDGRLMPPTSSTTSTSVAWSTTPPTGPRWPPGSPRDRSPSTTAATPRRRASTTAT